MANRMQSGRIGGMRLKFGNDHKGLILLAARGLQSCSFKENADLALAAAARVQDAARTAGFVARVGVTSCNVFAGLLGSDHHREYTVIGDALNCAAAFWAAAAARRG